MVRNDAINIFTDGSSFSRPRIGGMGIRLVFVDADANEITEDYAPRGRVGATNNQMEVEACINGLRIAHEHPRSRDYQRRFVFSDSKYLVDNWRFALDSWPNSGWYTREGRPVLNADLWKELAYWLAHTERRVEFFWIKGHAKNVHNKAADRLAKQSAKSVIGPLFNPPLSVVDVRRRLTKHSVQVGSVAMLGQRMRIRIVTSEYLRVQKIYKYRYEVISKRSRFRGLVDFAFSGMLLDAGHHYEVVLNRDPGAPGFASLCRELERRVDPAQSSASKTPE